MITRGADRTILISGWNEGINPSPVSQVGFYDIRNVNITTTPGVAQCNFQLNATTPANITAPTFTATPADDTLTLSGTLRYNGLTALARAVTLTTTGTLPAPLATATVYYVIDVNSSTIKLATTYANAIAGTAIDITNTGSGTHTINVINPKLIKYFVKDSFGTYGLDSDGRLWWDGNSSGNLAWILVYGNTTLGTGNGLVAWKGYIFIFRNDTIDVFQSSTVETTQTWTLGWQSTLATSNHSSIVGQDNIIYFCNGADATAKGVYYIGSIKENTPPFAPGTAGSFTFNNQALNIPAVPTCLAELRSDLWVGTNTDKIYPWNRTSVSFNLPITVQETGIVKMVNNNNIIYIFAGYSGKVYRSNGLTVELATKISEQLTNYYYANEENVVVYYDAVNFRSGILFTVQTNDQSASGLWHYNPNTDALNFENVVSNGSYGSGANSLVLGALYAHTNKQYNVGWRDSGSPITYAIDSVNFNINFYAYSNYESYIITPLIEVGTWLKKATIHQIELCLGSALQTGESVRISYRENLTDSFTLMADITDATYGHYDAIAVQANAQDLVDAQFKIELKGKPSSQTTPMLKFVTLYY